jgi:endo-1,3-1,4-beta-glycanase ExoK
VKLSTRSSAPRFNTATALSALALVVTACGAGNTSREADDAATTASSPTATPTPSPAAPVATAPAATLTPDEDGFALLYRDDFNTLDLSRWQLMTHSWGSNLALFSSQTVTAADGLLTIRLLPAPAGTVDGSGAAKTFLGAEVRSSATLTYGRVRARAKLATGSAVVSALVTIYTPWPADNWNEFDMEFLGADPSNCQFNSQVYTGPPTTPPVTQAVSPTPDVHMEPLGFDASADFHVYTIEWTPTEAKYLVDDEVRFTWTKNIALMTLPQNVLLTIWASSATSWAGAVTEATGAAFAIYDYVELYQYTGG